MSVPSDHFHREHEQPPGTARWTQGYWHILATGKPYHELGADYFTRRLDPDRESRRLITRLEALGHRVTLDAAA